MGTATGSPTVRSRRLGNALRTLRRSADLTLAQVADHLGCSPNTIHRIESGKGRAKLSYVRDILGFLDAPDQVRDELVQLARDARQKGWWHDFGDALPEWFEVYVGLEAGVSSLRVYETWLVNGLLQTERYARAAFTASAKVSKLDEDLIERQVRLRMRRQELLDRKDAPQLWLVLDEAALHRRIGDAEVMREQFAHLRQVARRPNITLQVLPYLAGIHASAVGTFFILDFPDSADPGVVYLEDLTSARYLEEPYELERYTLLFDHLRAAALSPAESARMIGEVAKEFR